MTDRRLQKRYLVTGLQPLPAYNDVMSPANEQHAKPMVSTWRAAGPPERILVLSGRPGRVALLGSAVLAAACGSKTSGPAVASLGKAATTTGPSAANRERRQPGTALAYVSCMRTHGEPNMPEPTSAKGNQHRHLGRQGPAWTRALRGSPRRTRHASAWCSRAAPSASNGNTITPADQADYLKAAACMRSHGVPNFPDPTFQNNNVKFNTTTHRHELFPVQNRVRHLPKADPSGVALQPSQRFVSGGCRRRTPRRGRAARS